MTSARFGPTVRPEGVSFRLWAPAQQAVSLVLDDGPDVPMARDQRGYFEADVEGARAGQRYWFRLAQGLRPDPASRFQPGGPLQASEIVDLTRFAWTDDDWPGAPPPHAHVLYEMHIGTFTPAGTWRAAMERLPALAAAGVTTLEVMPVAEFAGDFGWGYDGVDLFAPSRLYGQPADLQAFVNAAHGLGLAVILDVVYNHFGPVGNFIREFSPSFLGRTGEWGEAIDYDGPCSADVRAFMIENAAYWIREFHFDGLRFDATQAIRDSSREHIVAELCAAARAAAGGRRVFLVGESEPQDTRLLGRSGVYGDGLDAIWSEDWHHAAYVSLTGRRQAYFTDYQGTAAEFASMARHGVLYQGQWYSWQRNPRGHYALGVPAAAFVTFLENHDQVANTGIGTRLSHQVGDADWRMMTALLLLGPSLPMLFQGQEFGSSAPFTYFADHDADLAESVHHGRLEFLAQFPSLSGPLMRERVPHPADRTSFERCRLRDCERDAGGPVTRLHRDLIALRRTDPVLALVGTPAVTVDSSAPTPTLLLIRYLSADGHRLLIVNFGADHVSPMNDPLFAPALDAAWRLRWSSEHPDYGGSGVTPFVDVGRWWLGGKMATLLEDRPAGADGREDTLR